ncbi:hypothetical protein KDK_13520 [Dictyobacter kobayashii]|uniref:Tyrosine recombinase XerD n=2 Tax=Dictyobacter kobayashii TaxID=2014872 RepID=A0A402AES4_9CHLR|nr:hypothetical protein KDK_13520 [Dictyobacter kobayashii]
MPKDPRRIKRQEEFAGMPVAEAIHNYLHDPRLKRLSPRTREEYVYELGVFGQWCTHHTLEQHGRQWTATADHNSPHPVMLHQLNDRTIDLFVEHIRATHRPWKAGRQEMSSYTFAGYVRVIKSFLSWCARDDEYSAHITPLAVQRIEKPRVIETIIETFTVEQITALFDACDKETSEHLQIRNRAILSVLLDAGLRATELVTLTIGNVSLDPKDAYVRVLGKGSKWGEVGLGEQSRRAIHKYIRLYREPTLSHELEQKRQQVSPRELAQVSRQYMAQAVLFVNRCGDPLTRSGLGRIIDRLGERANIQGVRCSPHTFRHTFAVNFIRQGGNIYKLSRLLRHSSIQVTEEYLKSLKQSEARRDAKSVLDNL